MMKKEDFFTVRWNNILTVALGVPTLIYILIACSESFWTTKWGLIWLALIGITY